MRHCPPLIARHGGGLSEGYTWLHIHAGTTLCQATVTKSEKFTYTPKYYKWESIGLLRIQRPIAADGRRNSVADRMN